MEKVRYNNWSKFDYSNVYWYNDTDKSGIGG